MLLRVASLILLPIYLSCISPEEFGILEILNRIGDIVVIGLMGNGFKMAAWTFFCQAKTVEERKKAAFNVSAGICLIVGIGGVLACVFAQPIAGLLKIDQTSILIVGVITVLCEMLYVVPMALMMARAEPLQFVAASLATLLVRVGLTIFLLTYLGMGIWGILIARIATALAIGGLLNVRELRNSIIKVDKKVLNGVIKFAIPFMPSGLLSFFIVNGDRFFLLEYVGEAEVGIYALGYRFAELVGVFAIGPIYKTWGARMYSVAKEENAPIVFGEMFTRILGFGMLVSLCILMWTGDLIYFFGGDEYLTATLCLPPLLASVLFRRSADLMDSGFYIERKTKYKPYIFAVTAVVIFVLYVLWIPKYHMLGAAWATAIAYFVHMVATYFVSQRVFFVRYERKRLLILSGLTASAGCLFLFVPSSNFQLLLNIAIMAAWSLVVWSIASDDEKGMARKFLGIAKSKISRFMNSGDHTIDQRESRDE